MPLERDILAKLNEVFPPQQVETAIELLESSGKSGRIARCIVASAGGSLEILRHYIDVAEQDDRDVIMAAEHDDMHRRLRDFSSSFLIDEPAKMWISDVAWALQRRGYVLRTLETVSVNCESVKLSSELGEGVAAFDGDLGEIVVTKRLGQWSLRGERAELEPFDLSEPFKDERKFSDAVSCFILAKRNPNRPPLRQNSFTQP